MNWRGGGIGRNLKERTVDRSEMLDSAEFIFWILSVELTIHFHIHTNKCPGRIERIRESISMSNDSFKPEGTDGFAFVALSYMSPNLLSALNPSTKRLNIVCLMSDKTPAGV